CITVWSCDRWGVISNCDPRDSGTPAYQDSFFSFLYGFVDAHQFGPGAGRNVAKLPCDLVQHAIRIEIARDRKNRIVGLIVSLVIRLLFFGSGAFHIAKPTDYRISVGMYLVGCGVDFL